MLFCFCLDEISEGFHLRQIQTAVFKRTASEFTWICMSKSGYLTKIAKQGLNNRYTTMHLEFSNPLTGKARTLLKNENKRLINEVTCISDKTPH